MQADPLPERETAAENTESVPVLALNQISSDTEMPATESQLNSNPVEEIETPVPVASDLETGPVLTESAEPQEEMDAAPVLEESRTAAVPQSAPEVVMQESEEAPQSVANEETLPVLASLAEEVTEPEVIEPSQTDSANSRSPFSELGGLIGVRARASSDWLQALSAKNGYTVQMASFPVSDQLLLEEYIQLLSLASLIDETYLYLISATRNLPQNWLVIHGDFDGLSSARSYINQLPAFSRRYEPFVRNSRGVACLNNSNSDSLLAF